MLSNNRNDEVRIQNSTFKNINERDRKDWFADQYEKVIGKPLPRKELTTDEVLKRLSDSAKYRWIKEAKFYKTPVPLTGTVHYLKWKDPQVTKCMCPDQDCTCRGGVMFPRKKIPHGERYFKSPFCRKLMKYFRKPAPPPKQNFMQRLADVIGVEASVYKDLERQGILSIRGADFCISRCIRYYGAGNFPNFKYLLDEQDKKMEMPSPDIDTNKKDMIYDDYTCTVPTQSAVDPDGQFIFGNFSHVLFGTLDETVLRDIEGTELHISSYKCVKDNSHYSADNQSGLDKLLSWGEIINLRELKKHFSVLKRNIYSSIYELKENTNTSDTTQMTQCEEEYVNKKSSEKISIPTPYKGVVLKVKKEPQRSYTSNQTQQEVPQMLYNHSCDIKHSIVDIQSGSKISSIDFKDKSLMPIEIEEDKSLQKETTQRKTTIESAECNILCDSCINQQEQEQCLTQNKNKTVSDKMVTDLTIKQINSPNKQLEIQDKIPAIAVNNNLDSNKIRDIENGKETHEEYNSIGTINFRGSQIKSKDVLDETILSFHSQKNGNVSHHVGESIERSEVAKQLSKNRFFTEHENLGESGNKVIDVSKDIEIITPKNEEHSKCSIRNYFKKKLYRLSFEHLEKIGKNSNKIKAINNRKILEPDMNQYKEHFQCDDKYNNNDDIHLESQRVFKINKTKSQISERLSLNGNKSRTEQDLFGLPNISSIPLIHENHKLESPELQFITESKVEINLKQPSNTTFISMKETCELDEDKSTSNNNVYKILTSSDNKIYEHSIHSTATADPYKDKHSLNGDESRLNQFKVKNESISKCNSNEFRNIINCEETPLHSNDHANKKSILEIPVVIGNKNNEEESKKHLSVTKILSNVSFQLKKRVWKKINTLVKSLPERSLVKCFCNNTQSNMSGIYRKMNIRRDEEGCNEEPKSSEKEVFSIRYSARISESKSQSQMMQRNCSQN